MDHNVGKLLFIVNTMDQDVSLGIVGAITQSDIAPMRGTGRIGDYALIYRIARMHQSGGYGDQERHPLAWAAAVYVDGQLYRVFNARGAGREWVSLDKLAGWLRDQGFWYWWTRNDLEVLGAAEIEFEVPNPPDMSL
ncbi:MAG: hypothetical protein ACR2QW_01285 [bacterium]